MPEAVFFMPMDSLLIPDILIHPIFFFPIWIVLKRTSIQQLLTRRKYGKTIPSMDLLQIMGLLRNLHWPLGVIMVFIPCDSHLRYDGCHLHRNRHRVGPR